jgi:hypothetical protein
MVRNEKLHNLYSSAPIIRLINSRRMRNSGHVVRIAEVRNAYVILVGKEHSEDLGVDGSVTFKCVKVHWS